MGNGEATDYIRLIVDLDGTLYCGSTPLVGAAEALAKVRRGRQILFLSNNCSRSAASLAQRLGKMGFEADPGEVISSVTLMVEAVNELGNGLRALVLNSGDLVSSLEEAGHRIVTRPPADVVVVGVDTEISYNSLYSALRALSNGAVLVGANEDATYPTDTGPRPGAGVLVGAMRGMGFSPNRLCGKPDSWAMRRALQLRGFEAGSDCLVVGDRLDSDILGAERLGFDSALVLTGVSNREDARQGAIHPTYALESFDALPELLTK